MMRCHFNLICYHIYDTILFLIDITSFLWCDIIIFWHLIILWCDIIVYWYLIIFMIRYYCLLSFHPFCDAILFLIDITSFLWCDIVVCWHLIIFMMQCLISHRFNDVKSIFNWHIIISWYTLSFLWYDIIFIWHVIIPLFIHCNPSFFWHVIFLSFNMTYDYRSCRQQRVILHYTIYFTATLEAKFSHKSCHMGDIEDIW